MSSQEYALSRVRDALEKSEGNHLKAQRLVMGWLEKDQTLLIGLVGPHISGIVSHAINHVKSASGISGESKTESEGRGPQKIDTADVEGSELGMALLEGLRGKGSGLGFGESTSRNVNKPGKTSQQHIDAINKIAGKKDE